jgi:2-oxoglutarate dehydrogenase E1 component
MPLHARSQALIDAYRAHGYRHAGADPLAVPSPVQAPELTLEFHGLAPGQVLQPRREEFPGVLTAADLKGQLSRIYCGALSLDCSGVRDERRRRWLYARIEADQYAPVLAEDRRRALLRRLVDAQAWEHRVAQSLPHAKRFSLEGCESLVPLLDALIEDSAAQGVDRIFLGMPHRGRLNVLVNVMGVDPKIMLAHLDEHSHVAAVQRDLAYHLGTSMRKRAGGREVCVTLAHNPSHLQSVYPVVSGMARAFRDDHPDAHCMPLIVHGDAAFIGQGIVAETLNLTRKPGYALGGTVHVIVNNQIGFTTPNRMAPHEPSYCTDIARVVDAPVLRINADDPEAVGRAASIAVDYRMTYGADIVVDLVGYRRIGHSEHDKPAVTHPAWQAAIVAHPSVTHRYHAKIGEPVPLETLLARALVAERPAGPDTAIGEAAAMTSGEHRAAAHMPVSQERLRALGQVLTTVPAHMLLHDCLEVMLERWREALRSEANGLDWCLAENLAYASVLDEGRGVRISGMDVARGTFMHRHAVWHSQACGETGPAAYVPLRHLSADQGPFDIVDSPLTEEAVLGFEYGYSVQSQARLPIWEAQFGDFVNGAQVIIDQYIASGEYKWGYRSALTMLLPHGHEGSGPEHSSGYLSRFLQLCARDNLRVVVPSTSSQWFHLLREQAFAPKPCPLVVMSPKTQIYADPGSHAPLHEFVAGKFSPVIDDPDLREGAAREEVARVVLCAGKMYYELRATREDQGGNATALVRVEQLYPFPTHAIADVLARYPNCRTIVWAQEEEKSHGAWYFIREPLESILPAGGRLVCVCRDATPSGAHASIQRHQRMQRCLTASALGFDETYSV